jgi:uncharacterized repeat protein (TIGR01451 family)
VKKVLAAALGASCLALAHPAHAASTPFAAGSLIIPMDTDYQNAGMLTAFGLVDKLLRAGVTVDWVIEPTKVCTVTTMTNKLTSYTCTPVDMTTTATDFKTGVAVASHGYRGGPFVIDSSFASTATPIIQAWQAANTNVNTFTTVHVASAAFTAPVSRILTAAPRIAVLNDTNQAIAFGYLNGALIPDEKGLVWSDTSVDLLTDVAVGGTTADPHDGALFGGVSGGQPQYCEIMTMHWNVGTSTIPAVVAEMGSFLEYPVHVNAECQAVNAVEGEPPDGGLADFVTTQGFQWPAPAQPTYVQFSNSALPFAQIDGPFETTGGSEPAYALAPGSTYYNQDIVMIRGAGVGYGVQDLWMTGYAKGACDIGEESCNGIGKVSYLGGHNYMANMPILSNPVTQGARLFLNSLYEAGCVTSTGQPAMLLTKTAPTATATAQVTFTIAYLNGGNGSALTTTLSDPLPAGSIFVSATNGGVYSSSTGTVTWSLGDIGKNASGSVSVTVTLPAKGTYTNQAGSTFKVGLNVFTAQSNQTQTVWGDCGSDGDCASPLVCDQTTSKCVTCTQSEQQNCVDAGTGVCQTNDTCGCTLQTDCPSGDACDNGVCVHVASDAGADGGVADAGSTDGAPTDGGSSSGDATTDGGGGGSDSGGSSGGDGGSADATVDTGSGSGGGDATVTDATSSSSSGSSSGSGSTSSGSSSSSGASSSGASGSGSSGSGGSSGAASSGSGGGSSGASSGGTGGDGGENGAGPGESAGCGCAVPGSSSSDVGGGTLAALGLLVALKRRRRSPP